MGKIGEHETPSRRTLMRPVRNFPPIVRLQQHAMRLKPVTVALMHPKPSLPQHRNHRRNPFAGINARRAVHCECKMLRSSLLSSSASLMSSDTFRTNTPASMHTTKTQEYTYLYSSSSSMSSFVIGTDHLAHSAISCAKVSSRLGVEHAQAQMVCSSTLRTSMEATCRAEASSRASIWAQGFRG